MSYTYLNDQCENSICLPGQEVVSWAECFSDIPRSVLSNLNLTAEKSYSKDNETASCQSSQSGMMSPPSTASLGEEKSMLSQGVFLAKTSQVLEVARESKREQEADCGIKWQGLLVRSDQDLFSSKIVLCSEKEDSTKFCEALPKWGIMLNGECWEQTIVEEITSEKGCGFWPTPVASECRDTWSKPSSLAKLYKGDRVARFLCKTWLESNLEMPDRIALNPCWQEERMMWPIGQSDLKPLEMDKFQSWLQQHGESLEENK